MICASRNNVPGFGYLDDRENPIGFDIDLCRAVASAVLGDPDATRNPPNHVRQSASPVIRSGEVDMLVRTDHLDDWGETQLGAISRRRCSTTAKALWSTRVLGFPAQWIWTGATVCVV